METSLAAQSIPTQSLCELLPVLSPCPRWCPTPQSSGLFQTCSLPHKSLLTLSREKHGPSNLLHPLPAYFSSILHGWASGQSWLCHPCLLPLCLASWLPTPQQAPLLNPKMIPSKIQFPITTSGSPSSRPVAFISALTSNLSWTPDVEPGGLLYITPHLIQAATLTTPFPNPLEPPPLPQPTAIA